MKIKISELNPNPFKKDINEGKIKKEIVKKIKSNIKELGLMGSLPIFKKEKKYYLVAGHHRLQALKETFGNSFEVEVTLHNYSNENILRGMVVENLSQRGNELMEVTENLNAIRKFLRSRSDAEQLLKTQGKRTDLPYESGTIREIHSWLNKNDNIMSIGKISEYLKVYDNLNRELLKTAVDKTANKEEGISIEDAKNLARLDKKEQVEVKELLDKTGLDYKGKSKLVTEFINSPEDMQEKVLKEEIDIKDLPIEKFKIELKKKADEKLKNKKSEFKVTFIKKHQRETGNDIGITNQQILKTCVKLDHLQKNGVLNELDFNTMYRIIEAGHTGGKRYAKFMEMMMNNL
jgi:hypothetical protein